CDCGRYVEIWNLVFMQYDRQRGGTKLLPKPSVDTGMGLERVAAVLQNKISNFDTDLFQPLILLAAGLAGIKWAQWTESQYSSLRVIADHSRAATFLISDGVIPSNEGRGYVLRKIIRRAIQHGRSLGRTDPFLLGMVDIVCSVMGEAYPEIVQNRETISHVIQTEEVRFARTLEAGLAKLEEDIAPLAAEKRLADNPKPAQKELEKVFGQGASWGSMQPRIQPIYSGDKAFKLYDTYGLPLDFIKDTLRDQGIQLEEASFEKAMAEQQQRSKASWKGAHKEAASPVYRKLADTFTTEPDFYFGTTTRDCHIEAIVTKNGEVKKLKAGEEAEIVLDRSTIYAESGGQVADTGGLYDNDMSLQVAEVRGAYYPVAGLIAHRIVAKEDLEVGDRVATVADAARRARIMRNHTGTHLMNAALRNILGTHVKQAGSLNAPDHLRFDFSHFAQLAPEELQEIELQVNEEILRDLPLHTDIMNIDDALASGAL
ncbi:MAG TPA: alanine--tRNA ligase-related protein, partial [Candidatus Dormibacteraeota bacterium]|nr:alanine--tRNA ligase-related protein [Candidatus Dormibacteraeota bacterium]